jgi:hypothetical protein
MGTSNWIDFTVPLPNITVPVGNIILSHSLKLPLCGGNSLHMSVRLLWRA